MIIYRSVQGCLQCKGIFYPDMRIVGSTGSTLPEPNFKKKLSEILNYAF